MNQNTDTHSLEVIKNKKYKTKPSSEEEIIINEHVLRENPKYVRVERKSV